MALLKKTAELEKKIKAGMKNPDPEKARYWRNRRFKLAMRNKGKSWLLKGGIGFASAIGVKIHDAPHRGETLPNGKPHVSGGRGPAVLVRGKY